MKSSYKQLNFKRMTNLKSNLRKVATIIACLTVASMFASCGGKTDDDDGNGNGNGKDRVLTTDEKELVGTWSGYFKGFSMYYEFREDGTFSYVTQQGLDSFFQSTWTITRGNWSRNKDIVNMTKLKFADWWGTEKPPANLAWKDVSNSTMRIEIRPADFVNYNYRYFINHSIVVDDWSPRLTNEPLPSWLYLGK